MTLRARLRDLALLLARTVGMTIVDQRTGRIVGKAFVIPWRGKIHVIGLGATVRAVFLPQKSITYWRQEIGFATHPPPDYTNERGACLKRSDGEAGGDH